MIVDHGSTFNPDCYNYRDVDTGVCVMVVNNDRDALNSMKSSLDYYGYEVTCCENALEAMLNSFTEEFHYIVIDNDIPGIDGLELTRWFRARHPKPVIIGISKRDQGVEFLESGANDFMQKPVTPGTVAEIIDGGAILA